MRTDTRTNRGRALRLLVGVAVTVAGVVGGARDVAAQRGQQAAPAGRGQQPPQTPRAMAPTDFTGYWVAFITEDWRWRMLTAPKGDVASVPLNADGIRVANEWDVARDTASGEQCRPFGAAGIMRMPVRLHITWQDDSTLKMEIDNGTQTRLFHFDANSPPPPNPEWQGFSLARWEMVQEGQGQAPAAGGQGGGQNAQRGGGLSGSLRVSTTRMRPGYLRRNGVPYSGNATLTEFLDRTSEPNGDSWLIVTSIVDDTQYLTMPFMVTTHFKREPDGTRFQPRPCELTPPVTGARSTR
jgi:hypothetical protein